VVLLLVSYYIYIDKFYRRSVENELLKIVEEGIYTEEDSDEEKVTE
jgi:hypothetical protein